MSKPVCLIVGVGPGTGAECARRFSRGGYAIAMFARNRERLDELESELGDAKGYVCDVSDLEQLVDTVHKVQSEMGAPEVLIHNAVSGVLEGGGASTFLESDPQRLERNFRVNTTSLLYLAREVAPAMIEAGRGAILVTGNTSATRGRARFAYFAPTKAAQRILAQSMARDLGPKGVHVAYILIDAAIDTPRTRPIFAADKPDDFFCKPTAIADEMFHVAHQDRSAWSFDVEIRPFGETW
ncbi:MAG: SDR family NAD(P)-dependent oxidoreductase [Betaproteobacteria bacterium]|nr:MAG: SDR family NAD(P)-dependent oxidoreductase [Betaproteobacteria bacterium]